MKGTDPEFLEAARLIRKFFPESNGWITDEVGLDWDAFLSAMQTADYAADYSCDLFRHPDDPDYGLSEQGGTGRECNRDLQTITHPYQPESQWSRRRGSRCLGTYCMVN